MAAEEAQVEVPTVDNSVIVPGPALTKEVNDKKLAKLVKEGGKKGVEIEGAADMGGLQFFVTSVDLPGEDLDLLVESMKAMNAISDPSEEERKGGAGKLGKILVCLTEEYLNVVSYVPTHQEEKISASEWLEHARDMAMGGPKVGADAPIKNFEGISAKNWAVVSIKKNSEKNVFPLKMRDVVITEAIQYLKKRDLFPEGDDDEDEMVFGDDDFP